MEWVERATVGTGAGRNVNCCGIHAARVIVIHSYYTGNVCVERGV